MCIQARIPLRTAIMSMPLERLPSQAKKVPQITQAEGISLFIVSIWRGTAAIGGVEEVPILRLSAASVKTLKAAER